MSEKSEGPRRTISCLGWKNPATFGLKLRTHLARIQPKKKFALPSRNTLSWRSLLWVREKLMAVLEHPHYNYQSKQHRNCCQTEKFRTDRLPAVWESKLYWRNASSALCLDTARRRAPVALIDPFDAEGAGRKTILSRCAIRAPNALMW